MRIDSDPVGLVLLKSPLHNDAVVPSGSGMVWLNRPRRGFSSPLRDNRRWEMNGHLPRAAPAIVARTCLPFFDEIKCAFVAVLGGTSAVFST